MGKEEELLTFLINAWSNIGNPRKTKRISVSFGGDRFRSNVLRAEVGIPKYAPEYGYLPNLSGLGRYRIYRYASFHESMHQRHTLTNWEHRLSTYAQGQEPPQALCSAYNIVEDYRIDSIGTEEYKGMRAELDYYNRHVGASILSEGEARLLVTDMDALSAFFLSLWFGDLVHKVYALTEPDKGAISAIVSRTKAMSDRAEAFDIASDLYAWARKYPRAEGDKEGSGSGIDILQALTTEQADRFTDLLGGRSIEADLNILREYSGIERDLCRIEEDPIADYQPIGSAGRILGVEAALPSGNYSVLTQGNEGIITSLKSLLQKWQIGWREVSAEAGEELDMEGIVSGSAKKYYTEEKTSPKGTTYVLLDISGSITKSLLDYKSALAIICEVFAHLRLSFEVSAYAGEKPLMVVKSYGEPYAWAQRARLAGLHSGGGTPTSSALEIVSGIAKRHGIQRVFVITDGAPNSPDRVKSTILDMNRSGIMVYGIGIASAHNEAAMVSNMEAQWVDRRKWTVITSLSDLPRAFFWLMGTEVA